MPPLAYTAPLALMIPAYLAMLVGGGWTWFLPAFVFGVLPALDQLTPGHTVNVAPDQEARLRRSVVHDLIVWAIFPLQLGLLVAFLWRASVGGFAAWEVVGAVFSMALANASFAINVGHELGHRTRGFEQAMAKILFASTLYAHFFVEHNRGHHRRVATPDDPASAREGETLYAFWTRTVPGGWRDAWSLESERLTRAGVPWWSWKSEMVRLSVGQVALVVAVGAVFGPTALAAFLVAGTCGFLFLETVNYLEHYGLVRERSDRGVYERVRPHHSWNSNRPMGRIFLYDLTRHADHHANPTRPYQILRHHDDAPQLPAGYPAMILAAFFPPVFRALMEPALEDWRARFGREPQAT